VPVSPDYKKTTVLFANIRSFTAVSHSLRPAEKLSLLNGFFERTALCARLLDGYVDKITGDKIMMHWGAFRDEAPSPAAVRADMINALLTALSARAALHDWNRVRGGNPCVFSFGIGFGRACFPRFDFNGMFDAGLTGQAVETAFQCEAYTKARRAEILMTGRVWNEVSEGFVTEEVDGGVINGSPERFFSLVNVRDKKASKRLYTALSRISGLDLHTALSAAGPRGPKTLDDVRSVFVESSV
jgi:adenylate cyclase